MTPPIIESVGQRGKYRWRTWLRGHVPYVMTDLFPKGLTDCGDHRWHLSERGTWRCYHCEAGVTHVSPWTPAEAIELRLAALRRRASWLEYKPAEDAGDEYREIVREMLSLLDEREAPAQSGELESRP